MPVIDPYLFSQIFADNPSLSDSGGEAVGDCAKSPLLHLQRTRRDGLSAIYSDEQNSEIARIVILVKRA